MKKKLVLIIGVIVVFAIVGIIIFSTYRSSESYKMTGTVLEITNGTMIVKPLEGEDELSSSDRFAILIEHMNSSPDSKVGDIIEATYNGNIDATYPARLSGITYISVVASALNETQ